eukprot:13794528-Alexandrium_andersonii.AAC.1
MDCIECGLEDRGLELAMFALSQLRTPSSLALVGRFGIPTRNDTAHPSGASGASCPFVGPCSSTSEGLQRCCMLGSAYC